MDYDINYGDMSGLDFGDIDLSGLDLGNLDLGDIDLSSLEGVDLDSIAELGIGDFDLSGLENADLSQLLSASGSLGISDADLAGSLGDGAGNLDEILSSMGDKGIEGLEDVELGDARVLAEMGDFDRLNTYGMTPEQLANREELMKTGTQEMQITPENQASFDTNLTDIIDNRGGFTSQYQQVGSDRIMVNDDGTGIGINENGDPYALNSAQVREMVKNGQLNTFKSGYNTATGGTKIAPGGGSPVTLKNGKEGQLMPDGKVIDKDSGKQIGTDKDVKTGTDKKSDTGSNNKSGTGEKKDDFMKYIMLLMALDAMRNKGGGSSGAVIPNLVSGRGTTRYGDVQKAPGYRPGQGGVQYFGPTVYRAAGGGIGALDAAGGRLLRGSGDGVSDDIVAQIGDNQPARLADGEYVLDARTVSEIGNGSTDAGADKIAQMVERIHGERRNAKRGEPSNADRKLLA